MTALVAALYVDRKGPYWGRPEVDAWDADRDARLYDGPLPIVAHPPCGRWCRLAKFVESQYPSFRVGDDGGCFAAALAALRRVGGVLEHPAWSMAWAYYGLIAPVVGGWTRAIDGVWTCEVNQAAYGHQATKATWIAYVGRTPPVPLVWARTKGERVVGYCKRAGSKIMRANEKRMHSGTHLTPPAFAEALINLARNCGGAP